MRKKLIFACLILAVFLFLSNFTSAQQSNYVHFFVPNSGSWNLVSEINITDPANPREASRHYTVPSGYYGDSSSTVLDLEGNAWVGNRYTNTLVKVGSLGKGTCIDKNNNGVIDTSRDLNGNGVIDSSEMVSFESDECILKIVPLLYSADYYWGGVGSYPPSVVGALWNLRDVWNETDKYYYYVMACSKIWGPDICRIKIQIELLNGTIIEITSNGDYGYVEVTAFRSSNEYVGYEDFYWMWSVANIPLYNWTDDSVWAPCDNCDRYIALTVRVKNIAWNNVYLIGEGANRVDLYSNDTRFAQIWQLQSDSGVFALCLDMNNNLYAGLKDSPTLSYVSKDGRILKIIGLLPHSCSFPMSCTVDKNGYVWVSCPYENRLLRYAPAEDKIESFYLGSTAYVIVPHVNGNSIVLTGWVDTRTAIFTPPSTVTMPGDETYGIIGITIDKYGNIYVVGRLYGEVKKYDSSLTFIKGISGVCYEPIGIDLDKYENVWVACNDGQLVRLDKDLNILNRVTIGYNHYVYTDFTGYILQAVILSLPTTTTIPYYPIESHLTGFLTLIPTLLGNPLFFVIVFGLAVAAQIERFLASGGIAFVITFLGILLLFAIFSGAVAWWIVLVLAVLIIGGILFFKRK